MGALYKVSLQLDRILKELDKVEKRLAELEEKMRLPPPRTIYLPVGLQQTLDVLYKLGKPTTASEVASLTGKARAVESLHLNELHNMGLVKKERQKRFILFSPKKLD